MPKNKNQQTETSIAIYILLAAVSFLIATVVYFNGPDFSIILGYFVLITLTTLFYNYRICFFTAVCSIISYGLIIGYLIHKGEYYPAPLNLILTLSYFLSVTAIAAWLVYKVKTKPPITTPFRAENKTQAILDSLIYGVILLDEKSQIIFLNKQAEKILDIKEEQVIGTRVDSDPKNQLPQNCRKVLSLGKNLMHYSSTDVKLKKPKDMTIHICTGPIKQKDKIIGTTIILRDITQEKESDKMKSELISIVSHQLRTPLSAVKWSAKMLLDGDVGEITPEQRSILAKGYRSNERMIHLVNDLLNVSNIEKGHFQYKFKPSPLEDLIENIINEFSYSLEEKNMTLKFKKPTKPIPKVIMDPSKIHIVLQNLLSNAVNYTPSGGKIEIRMKAKKPYMQTSIKDNGMGIPKNQQDHLFTRFFRADNAVRMQTEGSGLGLFIAKNIIEKHKGKIWAESEENKGSTFYFTLSLS